MSDRHSSQMRWLENHLNLINTYSVALENLDNYRGMTKMMMIGVTILKKETRLTIMISIPALLSIAN